MTEIKFVDDTRQDYEHGKPMAEVLASVRFRICFKEMGEILAHSLATQQAEFFESFVAKLKEEAGTRVSFQWNAIAAEMEPEAGKTLLELADYLSDDEVLGSNRAERAREDLDVGHLLSPEEAEERFGAVSIRSNHDVEDHDGLWRPVNDETGLLGYVKVSHARKGDE